MTVFDCFSVIFTDYGLDFSDIESRGLRGPPWGMRFHGFTAKKTRFDDFLESFLPGFPTGLKRRNVSFLESGPAREPEPKTGNSTGPYFPVGPVYWPIYQIWRVSPAREGVGNH